MPFNSTQAILKRILPAKTFDSLYNKACNAYDIYRHILDRTIWIPQYAYYLIGGDREELRRIRYIQTVLPYTMASKIGVSNTYDVTKKAIDSVAGALVECGVARGGISALMALLARDEGEHRKTWLFDSFEGLPEQTEEDGVQKPVRHKGRAANDLAPGYCLGTFDEVVDLMYYKMKFNVLDVHMVKGWFQDTLPQQKSRIGDIAVLRLDGDWYESTKCCLENLYDNVVEGGWIIIDDYQLPGCKKAVDEYLDQRGKKPWINNDSNGRAYWRKQ